jgi:hypothetical protein
MGRHDKNKGSFSNSYETYQVSLSIKSYNSEAPYAGMKKKMAAAKYTAVGL